MVEQLRCEGTLHGVLSDDHMALEVKCHHRRCGYAKGIIVLHTFDLATGQLVQTRRFREPQPRKE